ncbi:hypothetical protein [Flavobacterium sp. I3-2]|uniref:hypothetical protein n=1 Tax=Flavobacterium sp. I3-2 TaxID=2748319 RepID=UPI0015AA785E|nr:hypothetical protein [Flavobacterium sp. I3-2]
MKQTLTTEQLQQIENKLYNDYDFYYDDSKYEIIDHIASEIEDQMQTSTFQFAFDTVFDQWKSKLQETEWNGKYFYGEFKIPFFYKQQLTQNFRKDIFLWILASVLVPGIFFIFKDSMELETINSTVYIYKIIVFAIAVFLNIYTLKKYENGNYTTVYGQIAAYSNKKMLISLCALSIFFIFIPQNSIKYEESLNLWLVTLLFFSAFYFSFIIKYCNYFRHLKLVNKMKRAKFNF